MKPFFRVQSLARVHALAGDVPRLEAEPVLLPDAPGRTLAAPLCAPEDLPGFDRATMDGYALRGQDTFGASEGTPAYLRLVGEVAMGETPSLRLAAAQCCRIGTGGMLPSGADAVVMVEHTRAVDETLVEVTRPVPPGGHVLSAADDARAGETLLPAGHPLRAQDIGLLAALGFAELPVVRRPRVAILSTGDEVVAVTATPRMGQVRDVNTYTLAAQVAAAGGVPLPAGLVGDDAETMARAVDDALADADLLLLSGGSSMGARDLTAEVFLARPGAELLAHGVSVAPGKPFLWVRSGGRQLLGLPGQVASCLIAFHLFAEPLLERMLGRPARSFRRFGRRAATLGRDLPSVPGREDYVRVRLARDADGWRAEPLFGKSGLIRTLTGGHGIVRIPADTEGLDAGAAVTVLLYPDAASPLD